MRPEDGHELLGGPLSFCCHAPCTRSLCQGSRVCRAVELKAWGPDELRLATTLMYACIQIHTYICIYIYAYTAVHTYTYVYTQIDRERERDRQTDRQTDRRREGGLNTYQHHFEIYFEVMTVGERRQSLSGGPWAKDCNFQDPKISSCCYFAQLASTVDSKKLEHGCRVIYAGLPFLVLARKDGHVPTFWLLLQGSHCLSRCHEPRTRRRKSHRASANSMECGTCSTVSDVVQ